MQVAREVGKHFEAGHYDKLPITVFPMGEIREALEFMKTGKHIGKVILTNYDKLEKAAAPAPAPRASSSSSLPPEEGEQRASAAATVELRPLSVTVEKPQQVFRPDGTYLITGGAGGFGSSLLRHAHYEHGVTSFLITTRSTDHDKVRACVRACVLCGVGVGGSSSACWVGSHALC